MQNRGGAFAFLVVIPEGDLLSSSTVDTRLATFKNRSKPITLYFRLAVLIRAISSIRCANNFSRPSFVGR